MPWRLMRIARWAIPSKPCASIPDRVLVVAQCGDRDDRCRHPRRRTGLGVRKPWWVSHAVVTPSIRISFSSMEDLHGVQRCPDCSSQRFGSVRRTAGHHYDPDADSCLGASCVCRVWDRDRKESRFSWMGINVPRSLPPMVHFSADSTGAERLAPEAEAVTL